MSSSEALSIEFSDSELVDIDASLCVVIGIVLFFCHVLCCVSCVVFFCSFMSG